MGEHLAEEQMLQVALGEGGSENGPLDGQGEQHLTACADCQARLRAWREDLAHTLLQAADEKQLATVPIQLKQRVLQATPGEISLASLQGFQHRIGLLFDLEPAAVSRVLADALGEKVWEIPGPIAFFHFQPGPRLQNLAEAGVVRLAPGMTFPRHRHRGDEHGLVLTGTLRDDSSGKLGFPGDIMFMPDGSTHSITAVSSETCLFVVLLYGGTPDIEWC